MFQLVDIRYVCLVHFLLHDIAERIVSKAKDLDPKAKAKDLSSKAKDLDFGLKD